MELANNARELHTTKITVDGVRVRLKTVKFDVFRSSGTRCNCCGLKGEYFALETFNNPTDLTHYYHFELYGLVYGKEIMLNKDHKLPVAKGGKNYRSNLRTLCFTCNLEKGDKLIELNKEFNI